MSTPHAFLEQLHARLAAEPRVDAAWLAGSFGRGVADRYSDLDLHLLLASGGDSLRRELQAWLGSLRPLVLYKLLFDDRMANVLTADGVRLDVWFHDEPTGRDPAKTRLLFDRSGRMASQPPPQPSGSDEYPVATAATLRGEIEEFWRCIALLPAVIGRQEWLVAWRGLAVEFDLVLGILLRGNNIVREAGVKRLNAFLPPHLRHELEAALPVPGLSGASLVTAHLALAGLVRRHGPQLAERWDFRYPSALEEAVLAYVEKELPTEETTR